MTQKNPSWRYYNHAAVPATAPHEEPDLTPIKDGSIWHLNGKKPLLARWTTDWDCGYDTGWWYIIKDAPFDMNSLNANRRRKINLGNRYFDVREITPTEFADDLADVQEKAFSAYPKKYRPSLNKEKFKAGIQDWDAQILAGKMKFLGAFYKENSKLCGYVYAVFCEHYCSLAVQKTNPDFEKYNVNAALVYGLLESLQDKLGKDFYICDGSRSISHETHFQDYLEKYFGFRKAYCKLNVAYPPPCKFMITLIRPFRKIISFAGKYIGKAHLVDSVLKMDEIARNCKR